MLSRDLQGGFSLIELMTAITIMGILIALGMPSLNTYLQTAKLGTLARSFYTGVQLARSEAIRLNQRVDFVQTNDPVNSPASALAAASSVTGVNWVVRYVDQSGAASAVEAKSALEGGGSGMTATGSSASITFNGLGAPATAASAQVQINAPTGQCAPSGPLLCWQVNVSAGGQVRLCNPSITVSAVIDSRSCLQ